jgi:hypothetical protein
MIDCSVKEDVQGRDRDLAEVLSQHMPEGPKKNHTDRQLGQPISQ